MTEGVWVLETSRDFDREIRRLDRPVGRRIIAGLEEIVAGGDPRTRGRALSAQRAGYWRYRFGDYRGSR